MKTNKILSHLKASAFSKASRQREEKTPLVKGERATLVARGFLAACSLLLVATTAFAENTEEVGSSKTLPGWSLTGTATVTRVYDTTTDNHYVHFTCGAWAREIISYNLPESIINTEHSYRLTWYAKANEGATEWNGLEVECGTTHILDNYYFGNAATGQKPMLNITFDSVQNQKIAFGSYGSGNGDWNIDNVALYDVTIDSACTNNLITNGDFETGMKVVEDLSYSDGVLSWNYPDGVQWDGVNIYKISDGEATLLAKNVTADEYDISNEDTTFGFSIRVMLVVDNEEQGGVSVEVSGSIEMGDVIFQNSKGKQITALTAGEKVIPQVQIKNNSFDDGYTIRVFVVYREGNTTKQVNYSSFDIAKSNTMSKKRLSTITIPTELPEDASLTIYVWDADYNIIKDATVIK